MAIYEATHENIMKSAEILKNGGLVGIPTETVYGLGGNAFSAEAVTKIFAAKERPFFDPLIVHIADFESINNIAIIESDKVRKLADAFWPGPLTMILKKRENIPLIVTSGLDTVAIRMPNHKVALEIIKNGGGAIAAPSANPFGYLSPTSAEHVEEQLGKRIDMIIDGGNCTIGVESTVIDMTAVIPTILRPGGLEKEKIESVIGEVRMLDRKDKKISAPGQMENHYAPSRSLFIVDTITEEMVSENRSGILLFRENKEFENKNKNIEVLSKDGDLLEASSRLFHCLHLLDKCDIDVIYAQRVPEEGLGIAIMDRLYKASKK